MTDLSRSDFHLTGDARRRSWGTHGFRSNMKAIEIARRVNGGGDAPTGDELVTLARFDGWGAVAEDLGKLSDDDAVIVGDVDNAKATTPTSYYTSPEQVDYVWQIVRKLGFKGGKVLDATCGHGIFYGARPTGLSIEFTGIDMDANSIEVAKALYPNQRWTNAPIETVRIEDGSFDLVVGNVPFAEIAPLDPVFNRNRHTIHNYVTIRDLRAAKPGALVAVFATHNLLDAAGTAARAEMARLGDLVFAQRFPSGAFHHTQVVVDLLVFRRHATKDAKSSDWWVKADKVKVPVQIKRHSREDRWYGPSLSDTVVDDARVSPWFVQFPELVGGRGYLGRGMYRDGEYMVLAPEKDHARITLRASETAMTWLDEVHAMPEATGEIEFIEEIESDEGTFEIEVSDASVKRGSFVVDGERVGIVIDPFVTKPDGSVVTVCAARSMSEKDRNEVKALCDLRGAAWAVLDAQRFDREFDRDWFGILLGSLNGSYDAYHRKYGAACRYTETRKVDEETGEETVRRTYPKLGGFRDDPMWPLVASLEHFDDTTEQFVKGRILKGRVVSTKRAPEKVTTAAEALSVSLSMDARVNLDRICSLLGGIAEGEAIAQLGDLVFRDPITREWEVADLYLSGEVRHKLAIANQAAEHDARFERNVQALEKVLPEWVPAHEIDAQLGSPWVPTEDVQAFLAYLAQTKVAPAQFTKVVHSDVTGTWKVEPGPNYSGTYGFSARWGAAGQSPLAIAEACLNSARITITVEIEPGKRVTDEESTSQARGRQDEMQAEFGGWLWSDPDRAARLSALYNLRFNSYVNPKFNGSHLQLPGLAEGFSPRPYQLNAVWRTIVAGDTLVSIPVGAGKTFVAAATINELRRHGKIRRAMMVVPNHLLDQTVQALLDAYPNMNVLMATKEMTSKKERGNFIARATTGDWDAIVITQSAFSKLNLSPATQAEYVATEIDRMVAAIATSGEKWTVKQIEKAKRKLEARHAALLNASKKDDGIGFEQMGVDFLVVDEMHNFRNLTIASAIRSAANDGSQRAEDLAAKLHWLRSASGSTHNIVGLTATPVMNRVSEMWAMGMLISPQSLLGMEMPTHDAWAAMFARTVTLVEVKPEGDGFHMVDRFASFVNLPELFQWWLRFVEAHTDEELGIKKPEAKRITIEVEPSAGLEEAMKLIAERARRVRGRKVEQGEDNLLKICTEGRMAALDPQMIGFGDDDEDAYSSKISKAAWEIATRWVRNGSKVYRDREGNDHPRTGDLQLVFCDLGTPGGKAWPAYRQLREMIEDLGVPASEIAFVQEASTTAAKAELFAKCRDGRVRILVGSTETMGTGLNVAERMTTVHHLTPPPRPADLDQRDGRALRPLPINQNAEVEIITYVTKRSTDGFSWELLVRKARWVAQLGYAKAPGRTMKALDVDADDRVMSYAMLKSIAVGNPMILEKAEVDGQLATLRRQRSNWQATQTRLKVGIDKLKGDLKLIEREITAAKAVPGDAKHVPEVVMNDDEKALEYITRVLADARSGSPASHYIGRRGRWTVYLVRRFANDSVRVQASAYIEGSNIEISQPVLGELCNAGVREALMTGMLRAADRVARLEQGQSTLAGQLATAEAGIEDGWAQQEELDELSARADMLANALLDRDEPKAETKELVEVA